jgi:2-oxoglutarate ferredoxin oxidoreductase subunit alpha
MLTKSFGSQIRGGESSCRLRVATSPVLNPGRHPRRSPWSSTGRISCASAANCRSGRTPSCIYEKKTGVEPSAIPLKRPCRIVVAVPMSEMAMKAAMHLQAKNNVVLGLLAGWFGLGRQAILEGIRRKFGKKGPRSCRATSKPSRPGTNTPTSIRSAPTAASPRRWPGAPSAA